MPLVTDRARKSPHLISPCFDDPKPPKCALELRRVTLQSLAPFPPCFGLAYPKFELTVMFLPLESASSMVTALGACPGAANTSIGTLVYPRYSLCL